MLSLFNTYVESVVRNMGMHTFKDVEKVQLPNFIRCKKNYRYMCVSVIILHYSISQKLYQSNIRSKYVECVCHHIMSVTRILP